jgi:hypothetical protein
VQDDHRPASLGWDGALPGPALDLLDRVEHGVERLGQAAVHRLGRLAVEASRDHLRLPAVAPQQREEILLRDPGEDRRVRDLVAVQVEDRQHDPVAACVEQLVRVPARRERAGLRLTVSNDAHDEQVGIVERRAEGVDERVAELAALVDRARRLRGRMARDAAGEGELAKQSAQTRDVLPDSAVELRIRALEVRVRDAGGAAVARAGDEHRVEPALDDRAVHVHVDEVQPGRRAEVAEEPRLHMLGAQRLAQERVVEEVDLPDAQVVRRSPVRVDQAELLVVEPALALCARRRGPAHTAVLPPGRERRRRRRAGCDARVPTRAPAYPRPTARAS